MRPRPNLLGERVRCSARDPAAPRNELGPPTLIATFHTPPAVPVENTPVRLVSRNMSFSVDRYGVGMPVGDIPEALQPFRQLMDQY
jgi:hypothetical protein